MRAHNAAAALLCRAVLLRVFGCVCALLCCVVLLCVFGVCGCGCALLWLCSVTVCVGVWVVVRYSVVQCYCVFGCVGVVARYSVV